MNRCDWRSCLTVSGFVALSLLASPRTAHADDSAQTVLVHIESPIAAQLERRASDHDAWEVACNAPCDRELPLRDMYRVAYGKDAHAGDAFQFKAARGEAVWLMVAPGSTSGKVAGTGIVVLGAGVAGFSVVGLVVGVLAAERPRPSCGPESSDWCGSGPAIGQALALFSGLGILLGAGIIAGGVSVLNGAAPSATQAPVPMTAFVREPTWTAPRVASTGKPAFVVPLSFSF